METVESEFEQSEHVTSTKAPPVVDVAGARDVVARIRARLRAAVRGRDEVIDLILVALLADGHVLLEDHPGSGKTTLAKALGDCLIDDEPDDHIVTFRRIQFTPDLLPSDVTGATVFDPHSGKFSFRPGPVFAHVVLADEINRTSPKVQAALLEAMAEKQVTVDNRTRRLDAFFLVIATQNPLDLAGTFPLPAAQLDRFLFKIRMNHIDRAAELAVLEDRLGPTARRAAEGLPRVTRTEVLDARAVSAGRVHVAAAIRECVVDFAGKTRSDPRVLQGASTRSLVLLLPALQARALLAGRDHVTADDVEALAPHVFAHRLELSGGVDPVETVVGDCLFEPLERLARATMKR